MLRNHAFLDAETCFVVVGNPPRHSDAEALGSFGSFGPLRLVRIASAETRAQWPLLAAMSARTSAAPERAIARRSSSSDAAGCAGNLARTARDRAAASAQRALKASSRSASLTSAACALS